MVPRLRDDGSNWVDYEHKARTAMGAKGLLRHVDGTTRKPIPYVTVGGLPVKADGNPTNDDEIDAKERWLDEFEQKEYAACHIILMTVSL
jgi:hypothetical protein